MEFVVSWNFYNNYLLGSSIHPLSKVNSIIYEAATGFMHFPSAGVTVVLSLALTAAQIALVLHNKNCDAVNDQKRAVRFIYFLFCCILYGLCDQ